MLNIFRNSISKTIIQSGCPLPRTINPINIKVVGVGGAGTNAISQLNDVYGKELDIIAINTDTQALQQISHLRTFAIGPLLTRGMGAGCVSARPIPTLWPQMGFAGPTGP